MKITKINSDDYTLFTKLNSAVEYKDCDNTNPENTLEVGDEVSENDTVYIHDMETNDVHTYTIAEIIAEDKFFSVS